MHQIIIESIEIPYLKLKRNIRIYLPPNYNDMTSFPVIYMHDAQNLFDIETSSYGAIWNIHDHLNKYLEKHLQGYIVVGIDNYEGRFNRLDEYSPWINTTIKDNSLLADIKEDVGGLGAEYIEFIVNDLKPYIDGLYKTKPEREHTSMIGSSMGGLISLYAGLTYPHIFSKIGAFSTAIWFAEQEMLDLIESSDFTQKVKWYLDIGTKETSNDAYDDFNQLYVTGTLKVHETLHKHVDKEQLLLVVDNGGIHNEKDWSKRFYNAIEFLL